MQLAGSYSAGLKPTINTSTAGPPVGIPASLEANAFQAFMNGAKSYWGSELYREVIGKAEAAGATSVAALEECMRDDAAYRMYAWIERRVQQFKWHGRWGFVTALEPHRAELDARIAGANVDKSADNKTSVLELDPTVTVPDYVEQTDTHQSAGGLWRDAVNAYSLAWYQKGPSFSGPDPDALVNWYARLLKERAAERGLKPLRIVDLGCTAGRSSRAIKRVMPEAQVTGCDVCEPTLRHGHVVSAGDPATVTLSQQSAEALRFADASVDVVASHWLVHEMPPRAIRRSIAEVRRVLRPGGMVAIYDMIIVPGGITGEWLQSGYAARNNEPFAHTLYNFDFRRELEAAGFTDVRIELTSPQHPGPDIPERLPANRLHYMTLVTAFVQENFR